MRFPSRSSEEICSISSSIRGLRKRSRPYWLRFRSQVTSNGSSDGETTEETTQSSIQTYDPSLASLPNIFLWFCTIAYQRWDNLIPYSTVIVEVRLDPRAVFQIGRLGDVARMIHIDVSWEDHSEEAHIVRFVGQSWMPMAADYRPVCLLQAGNDRSKSGVEYVEVADLKPGMRIIVREGGEKDVIKAIAQQSCGQERYDRLWEKASLWRDALRDWGTDAGRIARKLQDCGLQRHIVTLRSWVTNKNLIGPRSEDDVLAIARAFPSEARTVADWKDCWNAISELRGHHLSAGMRLTNDLVARCGRMLLEPSENETAVEFDLGTVWILEVAEVEPAMRSCTEQA